MKSYKTYDEISNQPRHWAETVEKTLAEKEGIKQTFGNPDLQEIVFIGCGTSYYLAISAAQLMQTQCGILCRAVPASEIFLQPKSAITPNLNTLFVGISRSGTSTEVVLAIEYIQKHKLGATAAITCNAEGTLGKITDFAIKLAHVQEKSVVMTGSFTNMLLASQLVSAIVSEDEEHLQQLQQLPVYLEKNMASLEQQAKAVGEDERINHFVILGIGAYYGYAMEGMLKMKEMTQLPVEMYNPLEFRHGPISVVHEACSVILLANQESESYEVSVINDVRKHQAHAIVIGDQLDEFTADLKIDLASGLNDQVRGLLYLPFLQYLAYYRTLLLGLNPDQPRILTQVVTF